MCLYRLKPAYPQSSNAIDDLVNLFGRVLWRFHFEPNAGMKETADNQGLVCMQLTEGV